jgi:hypothetical protein
MYRYMIRVTGLGPVTALFLPSALTDAEARRVARAGYDPRVTIVGLYRVHRVVDSASNGSSLYLHTGIKRKAKGDLHHCFFFARSDADALMQTVARGWDKENKLYRCSEIPLG